MRLRQLTMATPVHGVAAPDAQTGCADARRTPGLRHRASLLRAAPQNNSFRPSTESLCKAALIAVGRSPEGKQVFTRPQGGLVSGPRSR